MSAVDIRKMYEEAVSTTRGFATVMQQISVTKLGAMKRLPGYFKKLEDRGRDIERRMGQLAKGAAQYPTAANQAEQAALPVRQKVVLAKLPEAPLPGTQPTLPGAAPVRCFQSGQ